MENKLLDTAESIFNTNIKEDTLYYISNGNFWFEKNKRIAKQYSQRLGLELLAIKRADITATDKATPVKKTKTKPRKKVSKKIKK